MNIWHDRIFRLFIHRSVRGVCPRTPREIRLYQDEREIRARNGTGGGHGLLKNEEKKERSRKERIQAGGGKPGRVTMSFLLLLLLPTRGRAFLFFPLSHACKTRGNESAIRCVLWCMHTALHRVNMTCSVDPGSKIYTLSNKAHVRVNNASFPL